ncbi:hypothetical protein [Nocardia acidivorans]|uniref:hypothetical protein n=1 Tax=Nocardia acidivorans TaxID=404580 RepID=UPI00083682E1|nr:hypothetical protein [Nocardia acidivorans]
MRTSVHLLLFASAIAIAVGAFGPLLDSLKPQHISFDNLRNGFPDGQSIEQLGHQSVNLWTSLAIGLLAVAAVTLIAALVGSRTLAALAVLVGLAGLGVLTWRLDQNFDDRLRHDYSDLLNGSWGLYLAGGGLIVALLCVLAPRERIRAGV